MPKDLVVRREGEKRPGPASGLAIEVGGKRVTPKRLVDIGFVFDTTGSMSDKIEALLETVARFADDLARLALDHRLALVSFGDLQVPTDKIEATDFTSDSARFKRWLKGIPRNSGGGNEGESSLEAISAALKLPFRVGAVKVLIVITDEPAHQRDLRARTVTETLLKREILTFCVTPPLRYFQEMATRTGGRWFQVAADTDFRSILDIFRQLSREVAKVVSDVHQLGEGSVRKYRQLPSGKK